MNARSVLSEWAVMSKPPGATDDYRIVDCSLGQDDHMRFEQLIRLVNPGTPRGRRDGAMDALPWVTFSAPEASGDGRRWSAVAVREWSDELDASDRAIMPTRYFTFPYEDGAQAGIGYRDLYEAVLRSPSPGPSGEQVRLEPPGLGGVRHTAEQVGLEWCAGVAALLLEGPVVLTDAPPLSPRDRLDCLDAVVAFLPYGIRASLTASTWADNMVDHRIRLMFGKWARARQLEVRWGAPPPLPADEDAQVYLRWVSGMLESGPDRLLHRLSGLREPLEFSSPQLRVALERLQDSKALSVIHRLDDGVSAEEQRAAVRDPSFERLTQAQRTELLRCLVERAEPEDLAVLDTHWPSVAPVALALAGRRLAVRDPHLARAYLRLADQHGRRDDWLAGLLDQPAVPDEAAIPLLVPGGPPGLLTCAALLARPLALYRLITQLVAENSAEDLRAWVRQYTARDFADSCPTWLLAYASVLRTPPKPPPEATLTSLHDVGGDMAYVILLRAAADASRVEVVLQPAPYSHLLGLARGPAAPARVELAKLLSDIGQAPVEAGALLDVLAVLLGVEPRWALAAEGHAVRRYASSFLRVWDQLPTPQVRLDVARRIVSPLDHRHPLLNELRRREKVLAEIVDRQRITADPAVRSLLTAAENDARPPQLALLWTLALESVGAMFHPGPLLARWPSSHDPEAVHELLRHLQQESLRRGVLSEAGCRRLVEAVMHHQGVPHYAEWVRRQVPRDIDRLRAEIHRLEWLLESANAKRAGRRPRAARTLLDRLRELFFGRGGTTDREDT
ncbi:hypothetical protein [Nonomuraea sp. NPDC005650]|uniref:hypothetical protein n=1 Tax=Nonomuraea sp. NPDC005650 TaxID=3157045 RepID=UPI0033BBA3E4